MARKYQIVDSATQQMLAEGSRADVDAWFDAHPEVDPSAAKATQSFLGGSKQITYAVAVAVAAAA